MVLGLPPKPVGWASNRPDRFSPAWVDRLYGAALAGVDRGHPSLQTFAALLHRFDRLSIPVVVYIAPINVEYMTSLGRVEEQQLAKTIDAIGTVVQQNGGVMVDLHDLLPDGAFIDAAGHFTHEGRYDGPSLIAARLAPLLVQQVAHRDNVRRLPR